MTRHMRQAFLPMMVVVATLLYTGTASAGEDKAWTQASAAFEAGKYDDALRHAEAGLKVSREARLLYLKARVVWKLKRYDEAWSLMNAIKPNELPADQQDPFVTEYGTMELEVKAKRAEKADADASKERKQKGVKSAYNNSMWILLGAGVSAASGAILMSVAAANANQANADARNDPGTHGEYWDNFESATTLYWTGVGLVTVGAGLTAWGLVTWANSPAQASIEGWQVQPRTWLASDGRAPIHGLSLLGRF